MSKRVWVFGGVIGVFASSLLLILSILDVITAEQLRESLTKTLLVIAISTGAVALMLLVGRFGRAEPSAAPRPGAPEPPPAEK